MFLIGFVACSTSCSPGGRTWCAKASGRPHAGRAHRAALRLHPVHHVRGDVLRGVVLVVLQARALPDGADSPARRRRTGRPRIETFDPWHLPLINTLILLLSGCAATWAHHALVHENNRKDLKNGLLIAIVLGVAFTGLQAYEYSHLRPSDFRRQHLRRQLLHGDGLPRLPRHHRDDLPDFVC
jgi:hypothetical protein